MVPGPLPWQTDEPRPIAWVVVRSQPVALIEGQGGRLLPIWVGSGMLWVGGLGTGIEAGPQAPTRIAVSRTADRATLDMLVYAATSRDWILRFWFEIRQRAADLRKRGTRLRSLGLRGTFRYHAAFQSLTMRATGLVSLTALALSACQLPQSDHPVPTLASPSALGSATSTPRAVNGPIPVGTPVVIYWRTVTGDGLYAASWRGPIYKVPTVNLGPGSLAVQSPDGSRLAIGDTVYDTSGGATGVRLPTDTSVTWADDSRHVCLAKPLPGQGSPSEISYESPGYPAVVLGRLGSQGVQVPGATVLACSATSNRVVVANVDGVNDTSDAWVLDTATGAIRYHRAYPTSTKTEGNAGVFVVASPDGQYLAETDAATGSASIRRIADDSVVARLAGMQVHGFSSYGDLVLAAPRPPAFALDNLSTMDPVVIDWRTGKVVWRSPAGATFGGRLAAQPGGQAIALDLRLGRHWGIWMVGPDGQGRAVDPDIQFLVTVLIGTV